MPSPARNVSLPLRENSTLGLGQALYLGQVNLGQGLKLGFSIWQKPWLAP